MFFFTQRFLSIWLRSVVWCIRLFMANILFYKIICSLKLDEAEEYHEGYMVMETLFWYTNFIVSSIQKLGYLCSMRSKHGYVCWFWNDFFRAFMLNEWYKLRPKCAFLLINSLWNEKKSIKTCICLEIKGEKWPWFWWKEECCIS